MAEHDEAPVKAGSISESEDIPFLVIAMLWIPAGLLVESLRPFVVMGLFFLIMYLVKRCSSQRRTVEKDRKGDPGNEPESP